MEARPSEASKKIYERSEFIVAFAFYWNDNKIRQKIAPRIERKRDSIEFKRLHSFIYSLE